MTILPVPRQLAPVAFLLPLLAGLTSCATTTAQGGPCQGTLAIATDLPLSGPESASGHLSQDAAQLAVEQAQAANLFSGCKIQLLANDDASDPSRGLQNLIQATTNHLVVGMAGPMDDQVASSLVTISHSSVLPIVAPRAVDATLTTTNPTTFFRVTPSASGEAKAMVAALPKGGNILVLSDGTASGTQLGIALFQAATQASVPVVSDFSGVLSQQLLAAESGSLGAVLYAGGIVPAGQLHRAMEVSGIGTPFWIGDDAVDPPITQADSINLEGAVKAFLGSDVNHPIVNKNFATDFKTRFATEPDWYAGNEFDATNVLLYAAKRVLDKSGDVYPSDMGAFRRAMIDAIATIQWDGSTGHTSFDTQGVTRHVWVVVEQRTGGQWSFKQTEQIAA